MFINSSVVNLANYPGSVILTGNTFTKNTYANLLCQSLLFFPYNTKDFSDYSAYLPAHYAGDPSVYRIRTLIFVNTLRTVVVKNNNFFKNSGSYGSVINIMRNLIDTSFLATKIITEPVVVSNNTFISNFAYFGSSTIEIRGYILNVFINSNYFYRNYGCLNMFISTLLISDNVYPFNQILLYFFNLKQNYRHSF